MTTTPDGISMGDLLKLQEEAAKNNAVNEPTGPHSGLTDEQVMDLAQKKLDELTDICPDAISGKAMMMVVINQMIDWHTTVGHKIALQNEGDRELAQSTVCWLRDAGKFQAIANILVTISVGDDDFLMSS